MRFPVKVSALCVAVLVVFVLFGQFSVVRSDIALPSTLEVKALACLTEVYPVDLSHYNITLKSCYTLPSAPSDTYMTQAVDYELNSADSNLISNFLFRDTALYSLSLRVMNGSVVPDRQYASLAEAASAFLTRYQAFSKADSSELIPLLSMVDEANTADATKSFASLGDIELRVSHLVIPNAANGTNFNWLCTVSNATMSLGFDRGEFYSFTDFRQFYTAGSTEAVSTAVAYLQNYSYTEPSGAKVRGFTVASDGATARFSSSLRDSATYPCWDITLSLNQTYAGNVNAFLVQVWADSGKVFNCTSLTLPAREPTPTTSPTPQTEISQSPSPSLLPSLSPPPSLPLQTLSSTEPTATPEPQASIAFPAATVAAVVVFVVICLVLLAVYIKRK